MITKNGLKIITTITLSAIILIPFVLSFISMQNPNTMDCMKVLGYSNGFVYTFEQKPIKLPLNIGYYTPMIKHVDIMELYGPNVQKIGTINGCIQDTNTLIIDQLESAHCITTSVLNKAHLVGNRLANNDNILY